jgi:hypothetical protein
MHLLAWPLVRSHGYTSSRCISGFFDPFNNRSHTLHPLTNILTANQYLPCGFSNAKRTPRRTKLSPRIHQGTSIAIEAFSRTILSRRDRSAFEATATDRNRQRTMIHGGTCPSTYQPSTPSWHDLQAFFLKRKVGRDPSLGALVSPRLPKAELEYTKGMFSQVAVSP